MKTLQLYFKPSKTYLSYAEPALIKLMLTMSCLWFAAPLVNDAFNWSIAFVDPGIWQLILLALICWLLILSASLVLFKSYLRKLRLPAMTTMVKHFKSFQLWQQYFVYLYVLGLLVFSAIGCLIAIC